MNEVRRGLLWCAMVLALSTAWTTQVWAQTARLAVAEGRQLMNQGRYQDAVRSFQTAVSRDSTNGVTRCELGWAAFQAGDHALAERELDEGLRLLATTSQNTLRGACFYNRGRLAEDRRQYSDAEYFYQQSLHLRPYNTAVTDRLAVVRAAVRDPSETSGAGGRSAGGSIPLAVTSTSSSSHSPSTSSGATYGSREAVDGDRSTGWQVSHGGVNEWIRLEFGRAVRVDRLGVIPGYNKVRPDRYGDRWPLNNRVSDARIEWNGGSREVHFDDIPNMQWTDLGGVETTWVRVVIRGVYPGSRWNDTVISEINADGQYLPASSTAVASVQHDQGAGTRETNQNGAEAEASVDEGSASAATSIDVNDQNVESSTGLFVAAGVGATIVVALMVFLTAFFVARRGRREEVVLVRRAQAAHEAVEAEVAALGKAFDHVAGASRQLWARARQTVEHLSVLRAALRRTGKLAGAAASNQRDELSKQEDAAIARLEAIAERLEATVVQLASQRAGQVRANDVDGLLGQLNQEIDTAVAADREAQEVLSDCGVDAIVLTTEPAQVVTESSPKRGKTRRRWGRRASGLVALGALGLGTTAVLVSLTLHRPDEAFASPVVGTIRRCAEGQVYVSNRCADVAAPGLWVGLSPGEFTMGGGDQSDAAEQDEVPHSVRLTHWIVMQATEVTQGQYRDIMGDSPSRFRECGDDCPVESVTWHDAATYCNRLSTREGLERCYSCRAVYRGTRCSFSGNPYECTGYRLPTEAEWEYAALAGSWQVPQDDVDLRDVAWFADNSRVTYRNGYLPSGRIQIGTQRVASRRPNDWGLYDMLGSVWEWNHDWHEDYSRRPSVDVYGPDSGRDRILRGGSWWSESHLLRASNRERSGAHSRFDTVGFRVVRTIPNVAQAPVLGG